MARDSVNVSTPLCYIAGALCYCIIEASYSDSQPTDRPAGRLHFGAAYSNSTTVVRPCAAACGIRRSWSLVLIAVVGARARAPKSPLLWPVSSRCDPHRVEIENGNASATDAAAAASGVSANESRNDSLRLRQRKKSAPRDAAVKKFPARVLLGRCGCEFRKRIAQSSRWLSMQSWRQRLRDTGLGQSPKRKLRKDVSSTRCLCLYFRSADSFANHTRWQIRQRPNPLESDRANATRIGDHYLLAHGKCILLFKNFSSLRSTRACELSIGLQ